MLRSPRVFLQVPPLPFASPTMEQLSPQMQLVIDALDGKPLPEVMPIACDICRSPIYCSCPVYGPWPLQKPSTRLQKPYSPGPDNLIWKIKFENNTLHTVLDTEPNAWEWLRRNHPESVAFFSSASSSGATSSPAASCGCAIGPSRPPASSSKPRPLQTPVLLGSPKGQRSWEEVAPLLSDSVACLERCKKVLQQILDDCHRIYLWLPSDGRIDQHVKQVVRNLLPGHHFKIGITDNPPRRFYEPWYAYWKEHAKSKDRIAYEGMYVVYMHQSRSTVAMAEHCLISFYTNDCLFKKRCANRKDDLDDHIRHDESDEERSDSPGPHFLYVAFGPFRR